MHGIGLPFALRSFSTFSLPPFLPLASQCPPDPTFPTVGFPNPEEKGALDLAMSDKGGADIILANDPDADRLAVAERDRKSGEWTVFRGDQIGTMLGKWLFDSRVVDDRPVAMVASTVSSKMLGAIAQTEGFLFVDTLTGFKWIGSKSVELIDEGYNVLFGYEEAIGFCCGDVINDKDGICAMGVFAELAYSIYSKGSNIKQHMQSLYDTYGEFVTNNGYFFCHDKSKVSNIFERIANGGAYMTEAGGYEIASIRDLGFGYDSSTEDKKPTLPVSR